MLHLLYGPAASGKTDLLMGRIRTAVAARTPGQVLLVPEQYSHEAERALCAVTAGSAQGTLGLVAACFRHEQGAPAPACAPQRPCGCAP